MLTPNALRGKLPPVEAHEPADPRGQERAPESSAPESFESREPLASSHAAHESGPIDNPGETARPPGAGPREGRGGFRGSRDRGGRGRGGRRPPPRRAGYDLPPRDDVAPRPAEPDEFREPAPARVYDDEPEAVHREPVADDPEHLHEDEGAPEAVGDDRPETDEFVEERTEAVRPPERPYDRERDRGRARPPERPREFPDRRDRGDRRGPDRRGDQFDRERSPYRALRAQVDRIRHTLEGVLRDMERVLQTLAQAEQDHNLTEQELEALRKQIDDVQRGGGHRGGGYDRH